MLTLKTWRVQMLQNNSRAFDLRTFSVRPHASYAALSNTHTHTHGPLFDAHEVPHLKYAFLPPAVRRAAARVREGEGTYMVGVENVFWQVSLMRSYYEICKPVSFAHHLALARPALLLWLLLSKLHTGDQDAMHRDALFRVCIKNGRGCN